MNKDLKHYLKELVRAGFIVERGKKHCKVKHPKGKVFTCSASPSVQHAHRELSRDIRRYELGVYK